MEALPDVCRCDDVLRSCSGAYAGREGRGLESVEPLLCTHPAAAGALPLFADNFI